MEKKEQKEWLKVIGKFFKAVARLFLTLVSVTTKVIAIVMAKVSDFTILLADRLAE